MHGKIQENRIPGSSTVTDLFFLREFQFKLIHGIVVTKNPNHFVLVSNRTTTAYTVEKKTPLTIYSNIATSLIFLELRLSNGLTQQITHSSIHLAMKNSLVSLSVHRIQS